FAAIERGGVVSVLSMSDRRHLRGCPGVDLVRHFRVIGIVAFIGSSGDEARQGTQLLITADRLYVFVQNLIGCWFLRRIGNDFNQIWIFRRDAVLVREAGNDARSFGAAMAGITGQGTAAAELRFVDVV